MRMYARFARVKSGVIPGVKAKLRSRQLGPEHTMRSGKRFSLAHFSADCVRLYDNCDVQSHLIPKPPISSRRDRERL